MVNAAILGFAYGYFALNFDGDSARCYANDDSDVRLDDSATIETEKKYTNIGGIYDMSFKILFFCTVIELTISFFAYSISKQTAD